MNRSYCCFLVLSVLFSLFFENAYSQCPPTLATAVTDSVSCHGGSDGKITLTNEAGTSPFSYSWEGPNNFVDIIRKNLTGLEAGNYSVTITDANNCMDTITNILVGQPAAFIYNVVISNVSCHGGSDGALNFSLLNATPPIQHVWTNDQGDTIGTEQNISGLEAGIYQLYVKDARGCTGGIFYIVSEPDSMVINTVEINDVTCPGEKNGSIRITTTGGTGQKSYLWSTGANSKNLFDLTAGDYSVTVTDLNGCTATANFTIEEPDSISIDNSIITNVSCFGENDGEIDLVVQGGIPPFTYSWSTGETTEDLSGLSPGEYCVVITDANNCVSDTLCIEVTEPDELTITPDITPVTCEGGDDGAIDITVSGGTAPYHYAWSTGDSVEDLTGLQEGLYFVTVTDANECTVNASYSITATTSLIVSLGITNADCGEANGSVSAFISGGTSPFTYLWNTNGTTSTIDNLSAGVYKVTITDASRCSTTASAVVNDINDMVVSAVKTDVICGGGNAGTITLTVTGGVSPYSYVWDDGIMTQNRTGLAAGTYSVTVTDNVNCSKSLTVEITEESGLTLTTNSSSSNCGLNEGTASVTVIGGTAPFSYLWSNGGTTSTLTGLSQGIYTVTVTDSNSCTKSALVIVNDADGPSISIAGQDITCNNPFGSAMVTVSGGIPPYEILWTTGESASTINGLSPGTYAVTVTDSAGCSASDTVQILQQKGIIVVAEGTDPSCPGESDGFIDVTVTQGTPPFTFSWSTGADTEDLDSLSGGTFTVTGTDANGCSASTVIILEEEPIIATADSIIQPDCNGDTTGSIYVSVTGGTSPYNYQWSNGETTEDLTNVPQGEYCLVVTDSIGCISDTFCFTIEEPEQIQVSATLTPPTCNGLDNGAIDASATGGTPPYEFVWSTGDSTQNLTGITAGTYTVTVTDMSGCTTTDSFDLVEPDTLTIDTDNINDVTCAGGSDGSIDVAINGGTPPYSFTWSNGDSTQNIDGLMAGNYEVTVTDANGCMDSSNVIIVEEADSIVIEGMVQDVVCPGDSNGSITVTVTGGTLPYSYQWDQGDTTKDLNMIPGGTYTITVIDSNGCQQSASFEVIDPPIDDVRIDTVIPILCPGDSVGMICAIVDGSPPPFTFLWSTGDTTECISGLAAGVYSVTVRDDVGCLSFFNNFVLDEPKPLNLSADISPIPCEGDTSGMIDLTVTGGTPPYSYAWSTGDTTEDLNNQDAGTYTVVVTDSNGCEQNATYSINALSELIISMGITNANCGESDGSVSVSASGGAPLYEYLWEDGMTTPFRTGLAAGVYFLTVTDANGCMKVDTVIVDNVSDITVAFSVTNPVCGQGNNGAIDLTVAGGTQPYSYQWSTGDSTQNISGLGAGDYFVTVTDAENCSRIISISVTEESGLNLIVSTLPAGCGEDNGSAVVSVGGGTPPYIYAWSNGTMGSRADSLEQGNYSVTVTDANGCSANNDITIENSSNLSLTFTKEDVACQNSAGSITTTVTGGTAPYEYLWSNGDTTANITDLPAGSYGVTVTDAQGCSSSILVDIETLAGVIFYADKFEPSCNGLSDGFVDLTVVQGESPFDYQWSTPDTTEDIDSLEAGVYDVTVTDDNGCSATTNIVLDEPDTMVVNVDSMISIICPGDSTGSLDVSVTGGTPPYTYQWSNGDTTQDLQNVAAGNYCVVVTDANGCVSNSFCFDVEEPQAITITPDITPITCRGNEDGAISVNVSGGTPPYNYLWENGDTTNAIDNLPAGDYSITVTDTNNCQQEATFTIEDVNPFIYTNSGDIPSCDTSLDGTIELMVTGGTPPYSFTWEDGATGPNRDSLGNGTYTLFLSDANGCADTADFVLNADPCNRPPNAVDDTSQYFICTNESITIAVLDNDTDPDGDDLIIDAIVNGPKNGTVSRNSDQTVTYTSDSGFVGIDTFQYVVCDLGIPPQYCDTGVVYIVVLPCRPNIFVPNGFSPNGDGVNDFFDIEDIEFYPNNELVIFNRWGNTVREFKGYLNNWRGNNGDDEPLPDGTYYYILKLNDELNSSFTGYVVIHR